MPEPRFSGIGPPSSDTLRACFVHRHKGINNRICFKIVRKSIEFDRAIQRCKSAGL